MIYPLDCAACYPRFEQPGQVYGAVEGILAPFIRELSLCQTGARAQKSTDSEMICIFINSPAGPSSDAERSLEYMHPLVISLVRLMVG